MTYATENNIALNTNELQQLNKFSHDCAFALGYEAGSIEFCNKVSEIFDAELDLANKKYQSLKTQMVSMDEALNMFPAGSFDRNNDYYKDMDVAG